MGDLRATWSASVIGGLAGVRLHRVSVPIVQGRQALAQIDALMFVNASDDSVTLFLGFE
jgi:hypothetical protein